MQPQGAVRQPLVSAMRLPDRDAGGVQAAGKRKAVRGRLLILALSLGVAVLIAAGAALLWADRASRAPVPETAPAAAPPKAASPPLAGGGAPSANQIIEALKPSPSPSLPTRGVRPTVEAEAPAAVRTVDEALASMKAAKVAFNTPERGTVAKPMVVEAVLSTHLPAEALKVRIEAEGKVGVADLTVSDRMAATLAGGAAFDVSPAGPQEQWVPDSQETRWTWTVTPRAVGDQILTISFDAILTINGKEGRRTVNTLTRHIQIAVGWPETAADWLDLVKHVGEDVSWIWATLILPAAGFVWAWVRRRRRAAAPPRQVG